MRRVRRDGPRPRVFTLKGCDPSAQGFGAVKDEFKPGVLWVYNHLVEPEPGRRTYDTVSPYPHRAVLALVNRPLGMKERNPAGTAYHYLTLGSTGQHPEARADGDRLVGGGQGVTFDGKNLTLAP